MSGRVKQVIQKDYNPFEGAVVIASYTDSQALTDGVLFDLGEVNRHWRNALVNRVTSNLLTSKGYMGRVSGLQNDPSDVNIPNITDLVEASIHILKPKIMADTSPGYLYTDILIESPDGEVFEAWAGRNSSGFYTLMLPSDY